AVACGSTGGQASDQSADTIAHVAQHDVVRRDFETFLASTLGGPADVAAADAEVKSRLLDSSSTTKCWSRPPTRPASRSPTTTSRRCSLHPLQPPPAAATRGRSGGSC